ncbi:MAG: SDR family NAD(P)-dependent oxidoreductase [Caldilineaceae bacterium]
MSRRVSFELTDKVVVVTGAGRGIGKAIAEVCAEYGAKLALGSRTVAESEATAEVCRAAVSRREAWPLDVSSVASIREFIDNVLARYGRIDVLVSNAGTTRPSPPSTTPKRNSTTSPTSTSRARSSSPPPWPRA